MIAALAGTSLLAFGGRPLLAAPKGAVPLYKQPTAPIDLRVADLMDRMTLAEKVAQITTISTRKRLVMGADLRFDPAMADTAFPDGIGQVARPSDRAGAATAANTGTDVSGHYRTPAETIAWVNAAQHWAMSRTRLGIPILFHEEALHGYMAPDATSFPQAIALAGTFDRDLVERVNAVIASEVRAHGTVLALSPVVDIARDPRWGRIEETFGEDPYLCGEMGVAAVTGLQGKAKELAPGKVFATLKHMTGHGQPESGENTAPAPVAERELRDFFFPPFRAVVTRTGIGAVMPSYNEIDGVPSHANRWLLTKVLRGEWGFDGAIVSDYAAIPELATNHHVAADIPGAAALALAAGVDCDLPDGEAYRTLGASAAAGRVPMAAIDTACRRMLTMKFRAGLFEQPFADAAAAAKLTGNAAARALALEAARKSIALLVNDGTLPLAAGAHKRVAVIGPNAAIARLGGYSSEPKQAVSLLDGVRARLKGKAEIVHAQGVFITRSEDRGANLVELADPARNHQLIAEAVEAARGCDLILLAIGDTEQTSREGYAKSHLGDRTGLDLIGEQNDLFDALHALGKPIVVVAINGRPPSWPTVVGRANALIECWYAGQEGGTAIAEILFGDADPGARLPVTVARHVGQLPVFYDAKPSARRGYLFDTTEPLFPFGFGLSYTRFTQSAPRLSAATIGPAGTVTVEVDIANVGARSGDEVVQLYVHDEVASVTRPIKALKGFERVTLAPGARRTVRFTLGPDAFALWNLDMREVVEPGTFAIMTGPNSRDLQSVSLTIA
ncbi:glycoside hydrolase family 3 N-terminal domain-containing protein [Sphingomonas nostoxanthinifaciens]|uniref:glycoside hydrolase family 3 N-terminal domain-containing protein n=1 Tax=Sphingomonas nostoxanthinifaciens TaxID=2872652 RepID=UPI001CC1D2DD|nr:glycoside hydrolase family 3 N-terminal domain-containing protein [Sphingomonas nostoxanthinifaciens]UAK26137.1 glycoside hydrolase family 3 C-terminal domain-containing protein [Sphingomonas nostoxanthinifaciens]